MENLSLDDLQRYFVACGRCGHFLAAYRVLHGIDALQEALKTAEEGWLNLAWDTPTRELLYKSFGVRTDIDLYFLEHSCPDCHRRLVYYQGEEETAATSFRLRIL